MVSLQMLGIWIHLNQNVGLPLATSALTFQVLGRDAKISSLTHFTPEIQVAPYF